METLTKLSARSLEYYINARRWKSDLYFFDLEIDFLNKLMDRYIKGNADVHQINDLRGYHEKLSQLTNEKHQIRELVDQQLKDLELLAQDTSIENIEKLSGKHAHLDCLMVDWIHEYRKLKMAFFVTVNEVLENKM